MGFRLSGFLDFLFGWDISGTIEGKYTAGRRLSIAGSLLLKIAGWSFTIYTWREPFACWCLLWPPGKLMSFVFFAQPPKTETRDGDGNLLDAIATANHLLPRRVPVWESVVCIALTGNCCVTCGKEHVAFHFTSLHSIFLHFTLHSPCLALPP